MVMLHTALPVSDSLILPHVLQSAMDAVILVDQEMRVTLFSQTAEVMFGCSAAQASGQTLFRFMPSLAEGDFMASIGASTPQALNLTAFRGAHDTFPARASITRATENGATVYVLTVRDMTETFADSSRLERLGRLYVTRAQFRQAIRGTKGRQEMLSAACHALVAHCGFRMSWVGWHMPESATLVVVAEDGAEQGYLAGLEVSVDDSPNGQGPSGTAFREERPVIVADLQHDSKSLPWRAKIKAAGLKSSSAFPIWMRGQVCGTLNVYSDVVNAFQTEEVALLNEVADGISAELDSFSDEDRRESAEATARRERELLTAMVESMPGVCYLLTEHGKFLRWNQTFEAVTGYSADEIRQMRPQDFFPAEEHERLLTSRALALEAGETAFEGTLLSKTGHRIAHFFTGKLILFQGTRCLIGLGIDITELRLAQTALADSEARYRTALDNILEGYQLIGFDWQYKYFNPVSELHIRRPGKDLLGKTVLDSWPGAEETRIFQLFKICMEQRLALHEEAEFTFPDGEKAWFDLRVLPVPEGVAVLSIDITERRQAEESLRAVNADLENRIRLRTVELQSAATRAEASDRTKSVFLATMSHELRTPLNSIIGFTGIMLMGLTGPLNAEQRKQLGLVQASGKHLLALVNDVLDISKIEAGHMEVHMHPFDIVASVEKVTASLADMAAQKGLTLSVSWDCAPPTLVSDVRRFEQILLNLINNALKFTDVGGVEVRIDIDGATEQLRIRVIDTGIGINPADIPKLFQPFQQIDSGIMRRHDGTGLGLTICNRLLDYLGGEIQVGSRVGEGSTFTVRLPLKAKV